MSKKLDSLREKLEKDFGKGIVVTGNTKSSVESVGTGSRKFNKITDCGGIPVGKLVEIFGPESSGKSTICLHIIAEYQKAGKKCLLADYEYSFDKEYAKKVGVNVDELLITQPETMEDGYNIILEYIKSGEVGLVVIDSHTAMVPKARFDCEIGDAKMAPEARINSEALKKIKSELEKYKCTVIGISQLRANIGSMAAVGNVPTGGNAWKFYPDMRIKVFKIVDKNNESNKTTIEIQKNKCGKPYGKCDVNIQWGIGIDKMHELLEIALEVGVLKKSGSWYSYEGNNIGQGASAVKELFLANEDLRKEIEKKALELFEQTEMVVADVSED